MYLQIMAQIKQKVMVDDWPAGFHLPSIRELAAATGVSVITVKRAYLELEREGVIFTQQGRGSFVAQSDNMKNELQLAQLDQTLQSASSQAKQLGLDEAKLTARLQKIMRDESGE